MKRIIYRKVWETGTGLVITIPQETAIALQIKKGTKLKATIELDETNKEKGK